MSERFQTTRWSIVLGAGQAAGDADTALATLCETYRPPVLAYLRTRFRNEADAEDLAQAFFVHLLEQKLPERADRERGRFRSFLLKSLNHFVIAEWKRSNAQRRGGDSTMLDSETIDSIPSRDAGPEQEFDQEWARTVLREAMLRLENEAIAAGRNELFTILRPFLTETAEPGDYERIARSAGIRRNTVSVAVHRLRTRLQELVEDVVADTAGNPASIRDELRRMRDIMGSMPG